MHASNRNSRRRQPLTPCAEQLESKQLLTGGAGNTFALVPGTIADVNGTTTVPFTIDNAHFTARHGSFALGVDVAAPTGSTINPLITSVVTPHGPKVNAAFHSSFNPHLTRGQVAAGAGSSAMIVPVGFLGKDPSAPANYTVNLQAFNKTSGDFLVGFYLPGDANGDGTVNQADVQSVKSILGSTSGQTNYNFEADANRDGRIGLIDVAITQRNLGASTTITPVVTANLDAASDTGTADRVTNIQTVKFTGQSSPGATLTYSEQSSKVPDTTTTSDAQGNYSIMIPLASGTNTFNVKSKDPFGQVISGSIAPVTYTTAQIT